MSAPHAEMTSAAERFLVEFHARYTGATSMALAHVPVRCDDSAFNDSYDLLVAQVPADARRVLDVACGDGYLLSRLLNARAVEATGLDMSAAELAQAERNLQGRATLVRCKAQALPFSDKAFDVVISHMALMLVEESWRVLSEIRRVLRGGGRLAAVVGGPFPPSAAFEAYRALVNPHIAVAPGRVVIGDPQWRTPPTIVDLLRQAGFRSTAVRDVDGELELTPTRLWDWLMLMYDAHFLDPATRESIRGEFLAAMEAHVEASGGVRIPIRWMLVLGRA